MKNHALDIVEDLVQARYRPAGRRQRLEAVNLKLERMRHLFRLARGAGACNRTVFEASLRALDEAGRMIHGWSKTLSERRESKGRSKGAPVKEKA